MPSVAAEQIALGDAQRLILSHALLYPHHDRRAALDAQRDAGGHQPA
jgi:hypothetical protein